MTIVECIPNVSEGRRQDVIDACGRAVRDAGAALLDQHRDPAHNRSVFTLAGSPEVVSSAVVALTRVAVGMIDLRTHTGVHPRLGAIDVIPFVPIAVATIETCVALARTVGATIAAEHHLPVYLYEAAAMTPGRRRLEDIRRGQFEGLATRLATPGWAPDYGPPCPHPSAGATVVGARDFLVAYNINVATDRMDIARALAESVRERSGGLPGVKALGLFLADRGIAQVSMNLTDITRTTMADVFTTVAREAGRYGVDIIDSELVGLAPRAAFGNADAAFLKLPDLTPSRILEHRLRECGLES